MDRPGDTDPEGLDNGPISAFGEAQPPSDAARFRWIRANRNNTALHDALRHSHSDHDFDDQIDAAMKSQRGGADVGTLPRPTKPFGRRRWDFD